MRRLLRWAFFPIRILVRALSLALTLAYHITLRIAVFSGLLVCLVHFAISSPRMARMIGELLSEQLEGTFHVKRIRASPLLKEWEIVGIRVLGEGGVEVVRAERMSFVLHRRTLALWLGDLLGGNPVFRLKLDRADLYDAFADVDLHGADPPPIARVFLPVTKPGEPGDPGEGWGVALDVERIFLHRVQANLRLESLSAKVRDLSLEADLRVRDERFEIDARKAVAEGGSLRLFLSPRGAGSRSGETALPIESFSAGHVHVDQDRTEIRSLAARLAGIRIAGRGWIEHEGEQAIEGTVRADTRLDSQILREVNLVEGSGPLSVVATATGTVASPEIGADVYMERAQVLDLQVRQASGHLEIQPSPTRPQTMDFAIPHLRVRSRAGTVRIADLAGEIAWANQPEVRGRGLVELRRLRLGAALRSLRLPSGTAALRDLDLEGEIKLSFRGDPGGWSLTPALDMEVRLGGSRRVRISGGLDLGFGPSGATLSIDEVALRDPGMRLRISGSADLPEGKLALRLRGRIGQLEKVARPFATLPVRASVPDFDLRIDGTVKAPSLSLSARFRDLDAAPGTSLKGDLRARLGPDGVLRVPRLRVGGKDQTFDLALSLGLLRPGGFQVRSRMDLEVRTLSGSLDLPLRGLDLPVAVRGRFAVEAAGVRMDLRRPLSTLRGSVRISGRGVALGPVPVRSLAIRLRGSPRDLRLDKLELRLREGSTISGAGTLSPGSRRMDLSLEVRKLDLHRMAALFLPRGAVPDLEGRVRGSLKLSGDLEAPALSGRISARGLRAAEVALGEVDLKLRPRDGGGARVVATRLPAGLGLEDTVVDLSPGRRSFVMTVVLNDLDPATLLVPGARARIPEGRALSLRGRARLKVPLGPTPEGGASLEVYLPEKGLRLRLEELDDPVLNGRPIHLVYRDGELSVAELDLRYAGGRIRACGRLDAEGDLEVIAAGTMPLGMLTLFRSVFSDARGRLVVGGPADAPIPAGLLALCGDALQSASSPPLVVQGDLRGPFVDGEIRVLGGLVALRGTPQEITIRDKDGIAISGRLSGGTSLLELRTLGEGLELGLGDGTASVAGSFRMVGGRAAGLDARILGSQLDFTSPREYRLVANPDLRIEGRHLSDASRRTLGVGGDLVIVEGVYFKSFDALTSALGAVVGSRAERFSRPVTESLPVLKELTLDVKVRSSAFQVSTAFPLGKARLDLDIDTRIGGTLDRPEIEDQVRILRGSTITYSILGREFEVTQGTIEFSGDPAHPKLDVEARTTITYTEDRNVDTSNVRVSALSFEREEVVTVILRFSGVYPDLKVEFDSDRPEFDQADIQSLLFRGVPTGTSGGDVFSDATVSLLTQDVSGLLSNILLMPFIDSVRLGVNPDGGLVIDLRALLGRYLRLRTKVTQVGVDTRYDTGFQVRFTDRVYLEGNMKVLETEQQQQRTYEAKLKYRIPLDE